MAQLQQIPQPNQTMYVPVPGVMRLILPSLSWLGFSLAEISAGQGSRDNCRNGKLLRIGDRMFS